MILRRFKGEAFIDVTAIFDVTRLMAAGIGMWRLAVLDTSDLPLTTN